MSDTITIYIDQVPVQAIKGETILEAAMRNGIEIPNLCYHKKISHTGSCRLCIVRLEGNPKIVTSCTTPAEEGQKITAFSPELETARRTVLDLQLSDHNDDCINCTKDGVCELQDLAFKYDLGAEKRRFPRVKNAVEKNVDKTSPVLDFDASKCIQCGRCLKACEEVQGKGVLSFVKRGILTNVKTGGEVWVDSDCDGCGECVQICPVGALSIKPVAGKRLRAKDIQKVTRTTCPYCGVGCQLEIGSKRDVVNGVSNQERIITVTGVDSSPNHGSTCVKGRFGLDFVNHPDRLKKPLIRKDGKLVEVEWDEAIDYTARRFGEIKKKHGGEALAGLSSARVTNENNYVFQKFVRSVLNSPNVDHCARLCHASTVAGLAMSFGSGAMTNSIEELEHAKVILVTGSNTTETHPVISTYIKRAVHKYGAKLIVVDPREIDLVRHAALWLRPRNGTDVAWINGMVQAIIANGWENKEFIAAHTENFDATKAVMKKYDAKTVEAITGIPAADLVEAARLFAQAESASIIYSMGITQHSNGTDNVRACANLAMVAGQIGRPSTGVNPLRGQNNVQGACDMGALPNVFPGYQSVTNPDIMAKFEKAWDKKGLPSKVGLTVTEIMTGVHDGTIKGLYIMGENPMISEPDLNHVKACLEHAEFLLVQDIFLTETAQLADVVLPAVTFAETEGTFTNTERRVLPLHRVLAPVGQSREDWLIIQQLANAMGEKWNYKGASEILCEINQVTPSYAGITPERLENGELLQWPCPNTDHPGTTYLHKDGNFTRGKGQFAAVDHLEAKERPDKEYPYLLSTGRSIFHYHTASMTRRTRALPEFLNTAYVEMNQADCKRLGVKHADKVRISSRRGTISISVRETDRVVEGSVFIPFHFAEAAANMLTNNVVDPVAKIPEYKVCAVKIEK